MRAVVCQKNKRSMSSLSEDFYNWRGRQGLIFRRLFGMKKVTLTSYYMFFGPRKELSQIWDIIDLFKGESSHLSTVGGRKLRAPGWGAGPSAAGGQAGCPRPAPGLHLPQLTLTPQAMLPCPGGGAHLPPSKDLRAQWEKPCPRPNSPGKGERHSRPALRTRSA